MRPDASGDALVALGAATLGESGAARMNSTIGRVWPGAVAGPAFTVECTPGDNLAIHASLTRAPAGAVLVVDVGVVTDRGYWGEVLTTAAQVRGLTGLVIDGGVRDVAALEDHGFPVFASTVALTGASKNRPGITGAPIGCGGVTVRTGDTVVGDADGVVVIPSDAFEDVVERARRRVEREQSLFTELRAGRTTLELLDLDPSSIREA